MTKQFFDYLVQTRQRYLLCLKQTLRCIPILILLIYDDIALNELGIHVLDVRVKGIDLPPEVSNAVYSRMSTEREREARDHRSRGRELAEGIEADADRQNTVIEANAYREAEQIRGEGDAIAAEIYATAYNQDPEFYSFHRSIQAYKDSFAGKEDLLVIDPESDFFRYLKDPTGK